MARIQLISFVVACLFLSSVAQAETLQDALAKVYATNPSIQSERAKLRSVDEQVPEALSNWRPSVTAEADAGMSHQAFDNTSGNLKPTDVGITLSQPLYRGGRTVAATRQAEHAVYQERAQVIAVEQRTLLDAATAYVDLLQSETVLNLQIENEAMLRDWVTEANERFRLHEKTHTDVSLSKSRLARAHAERLTAEINNRVSQSAFRRFIGEPGENLQYPEFTMSIPTTSQDLEDAATKFAPEVMAAAHAVGAQDAAIDLARGQMLPELSLQGSSNRTWNENVPEQFVHDNHTALDQVLLQLKVPLYTGGGDYARLRAAYHDRSERRMDLDEAKREAVERAMQAWDEFNASDDTIAIRQDQVTQAEDTITGMKKEERVGDRSSVDVLDSQQDLLAARIAYAQAKHDRMIALFNLLASIGRFTAENLHLKVDVYDPARHYTEIKDSWVGLGSTDRD